MKMMRSKIRKNRARRDAGKVMTGMLLGSVFGAAVALLIAPESGQALRRRITGEASNLREKIQTSRENVESRVREMAREAGNRTGAGVTY